MRKNALTRILLSIGLLVAVLAITQVGYVKATSTTDVSWDGYGAKVQIDVAFDDDAETHLYTWGERIWGSLTATDHDDNPYGYGVDTIDVMLEEAYVEGTGFIEFLTVRTDSAKKYGDAGQVRRSYIYVENGEAFMRFRDNINYARLRCCEYSFQSNDQFVASGDYYEIFHQVLDSDEDGMSVGLSGSGSASLTVMNHDLWGSSWTFGKGCGCYTNAHAEATGSGTFMASAWADNYLESDLGFELPGGGGFSLEIGFDDGFEIDDFASSGN